MSVLNANFKLNRRSLFTSLVAVTMPLLAACGADGSISPKAPELQVADVKLLSLGLQGVQLGVDLNANNPNPIPLPLAAVDVDLNVAGVRIGTGSLTRGVLLQPNQPVRLPLVVNGNLLQLGLNAQRFLSASSLPYTITGRARIQGIPIPIPVQKTGVLNLR